MRHGRAAALGTCVLTILLVLPACSPPPPLSWAEVELPADSDPAVLAVQGAELLIGGQRRTETGEPQLLRLAGDGSVQAIALEPNGPYADTAQIMFLDADESRIVAVGGRAGGAHGNVRWTAWTGTATKVVSQPQTFATFGGTEAGGLTDIALAGGDPLILGTWNGKIGLDAAVWGTDGTEWTRRPSVGDLASNPERIVGPSEVASTDGGAVIAGSVTDLTGGVRQRAYAWQAPGIDETWTGRELPEPGKRSEAHSITCAGPTCWLAGYADDQLALWSLSDTATYRFDLPAIPIDPAGPAPRPVLLADQPGVVYPEDDGTGVALPPSDEESGWQQLAGPAGELVDAQIIDKLLYVVTKDATAPAKLWVTTVP